MTRTCDSCGKPAYPEGNGRIYELPNGDYWCRGCLWEAGLWDTGKDEPDI
jgi:hypothetical protein